MEVLIVIAIIGAILNATGLVEIQGRWLGPFCHQIMTDCN